MKRCPRKQTYWQLELSGWSNVEYPPLEEFEDIDEYMSFLGYNDGPDFFIGDELNYIAIWKLHEENVFLFYLQLDNLSEIYFAKDFPSYLKLMELSSFMVNSHLKTVAMLEKLKE